LAFLVRCLGCERSIFAKRRKLEMKQVVLEILYLLVGSVSVCLVACSKASPDAVPGKEEFVTAKESLGSIETMRKIGTCSLENVVTVADGRTNFGGKNAYVVKRHTRYKLIGFATNSERSTAPKAIRLLLVGIEVYSIDAVTGFERPDVATYFKASAFRTAGYQVDAYFDSVLVGEYATFVLGLDGGEQVLCPTHKTITIS
jgi:hypothetical protein